MPDAPDFYDQALLERFGPRLRYDRQYDYLTAAVETMIENAGNVLRRRDGDLLARAAVQPGLTLATLHHGGYPSDLEADPDDCLCQAPDHLGDWRRMGADEERFGQRVYGRCVQDGGRTWLQYWLWLYHNPKNLFGFGRHEGDWEMVQIGLGDDGEPDVATYAQHEKGEARRFADGDIEVERAGGDAVHPVVYVAPLSHASYYEAGTHVYIPGIDHPYGDGPSRVPRVVPFGDWVQWRGRWGNTDSAIFGKLGKSPASPRWQGSKWTNPAAWHEEMAGRRRRVAGGRLVHALGARTYPPRPEVEARRAGDCVVVAFRLSGTGVCRARHVYLTVHDGDRVLESSVVRDPGPEGKTVLLVPDTPAGATVVASAFNALRQRSELTDAPIVPAPAAEAAAVMVGDAGDA